MLDPGPRYRRTRYGWEPLNAPEPPEPALPSPHVLNREFTIWLIQETIDCGTPPHQAVKWWLHILGTLRQRKAAGEDVSGMLLPEFMTFLRETGIAARACP